MIDVKKIQRCGHSHHVSLDKGYCEREGLGPGSRLVIRGKIGERWERWERGIIGHCRCLHYTIPSDWWRCWRLGKGSWVVVLLLAGGEVELQTLPGASLKELEIRGLHEAVDEVERAEDRLEAAYRAGYAEGLATGQNLGYGAGVRYGLALRRQNPPVVREDPAMG